MEVLALNYDKLNELLSQSEVTREALHQAPTNMSRKTSSETAEDRRLLNMGVIWYKIWFDSGITRPARSWPC